MKFCRTLASALLFSLLLAACAGMPDGGPPVPAPLFADARFAPLAQPIAAADVFALSEPMLSYLHSADMAAQMRAKGPRRGLIEALYNKRQLRLEYDSTMTRNAAEAFEARAGNCLSLVIMTAAFAKKMDLEVQFQSVLNEEVWGRSGDLYLALGHVNLSLGAKRRQGLGMRDLSDPLIIDFVPEAEIRGQRTRVIGEETILAMYMNNRAAEALAQGELNTAYWWAREAVLQDPKFLGAYNTLGVVYRRHGDLGLAERVFAQVLEREPANTQVMSNLILLMIDQGRSAEADRLKARLAELQPHPPFSYFNQGLAAMSRGDFAAAKALFGKEVDRAYYYHEFHFWLALAHYALGEIGPARQQMALALENSTTRKDHDLYAAKLDRLKEVRRQ